VPATNHAAVSSAWRPPVESAEAGEPAAAEDDLIGQTLGPYQVTGRLSKGEIASAYTAVQVTINRPVVLKILDPAQQSHEPTKRRFIADARAKAHVQHPSIVSVYEAGEGAGRIIYAREYVDGQNLAEVQASGAKIEEATALKVMRAVAEGMAYLRANNIPHALLEPASIYLAKDGQARLANLATQFNEDPRTIEQEMQTLARIMLSVLPAAQQLSPGLRTLLGRMMQASTTGMNTWGVLLHELKTLEPKFVPVEAAMLSAQDRAAIEAVELARRQQRRSLWWNIASLTTLFAIVVGLILWKFVFTNERRIQGEVLIPAGTYKNASGKTVEIAQPFSIDTYEVTFAQYGRFLTYLKEHPAADQDFRHPRMPRSISSHVPEHWDIYFLNARAGGKVRSIPIDLNCPVITVTWWDAYAYASWLGRDLPTADEWEVAATGGKHQKYPWGDEPIASKANSGVDHHPDPRVKAGKVDGYSFWSPVDAIRGDKSPFGVVGMAGNVSEWTGSWTPERRPIIKGGSYQDPDVPLDKQIVDADPSKGEEHIGFRTIKRHPAK
jgi:formylglycine-generating enzyme required for sulfatase activity